jgi:hypothetical protein
MTGPRSSKVASLAFEERIDPASTALVVIDVQNDFAVPQGVCGAVGDDVSPVAPMIDRVKSLIAAARQADLFIIFVRAIYDEVVLSPALAEQYLRRGYANGICLTGSRGAELVEGIGPRDAPNEIVVTKHRYSAFWGSSIDLFSAHERHPDLGPDRDCHRSLRRVYSARRILPRLQHCRSRRLCRLLLRRASEGLISGAGAIVRDRHVFDRTHGCLEEARKRPAQLASGPPGATRVDDYRKKDSPGAHSVVAGDGPLFRCVAGQHWCANPRHD